MNAFSTRRKQKFETLKGYCDFEDLSKKGTHVTRVCISEYLGEIWKIIEKDFKEVWGESPNVIKYAAGDICQKNGTVLTVKDEAVYQTTCAVRRDWNWVPKTRDDKRNHCNWAYCVIDRETQACRRRTEEEEKIKKEMLKIFFKDQEGRVEEVKKLQKSRWLGEISNEKYVEKSE